MLAWGFSLPGNGAHLCDDIFQLVIDNIVLLSSEDCKHISARAKMVDCSPLKKS